MQRTIFFLLTFIDQQDHRIFKNDSDKKRFLRFYEYYMIKSFNTYAWCILPEKALFICGLEYKQNSKDVFTPPEVMFYNDPYFDNFIQRFNVSLRKRHSSSVFFDALATPLDDSSPSYLASIIAYLHCLPYDTGLSYSFEDYDWSSYSSSFNQRIYVTLRLQEILDWFGSEKLYKQYHNQLLEIMKVKYLIDSSLSQLK